MMTGHGNLDHMSVAQNHACPPLPALPGSASSSSKAFPAIRACATSSPQETHPLLSLPPPHLTRFSSLLLSITNPHHQHTTHNTNNSPNKPHQHFTMATLSCKSPLHPMQRVTHDSELLVCCHLPQQKHPPRVHRSDVNHQDTTLTSLPSRPPSR
jgi:hypothetical protein